MFINYKLPALSEFTRVSTMDSAQIAPGARIAVDADKGRIQLDAAPDHLALAFSPFDPALQWIELAFVLDADLWRRCRQIFLRYRASGSDLRVTPSLRLGDEGGFHDLFSDASHTARDDVAEFGAEFRLPPRWADRAQWIDLHLFFDPRRGNVQLYDLSLTGVQ